MPIRIVEEDPAQLGAYEGVSIAFDVGEVLDERAIAAALAGNSPLATTPVTAYRKDYDSYPGDRPTDWPRRFDVSRWTILAAFSGGERVGGATVILDDPAVELLDGCPDCALLWDIRVAPRMRGRGVGSALIRAAEEKAARRGARALRVETQQINVPACRFYARHGFGLERAVRGAYADLPDEVQLLWRKELGRSID